MIKSHSSSYYFEPDLYEDYRTWLGGGYDPEYEEFIYAKALDKFGKKYIKAQDSSYGKGYADGFADGRIKERKAIRNKLIKLLDSLDF